MSRVECRGRIVFVCRTRPTARRSTMGASSAGTGGITRAAAGAGAAGGKALSNLEAAVEVGEVVGGAALATGAAAAPVVGAGLVGNPLATQRGSSRFQLSTAVRVALLHLAIRTSGPSTWRLERLTRHSRSAPLSRSRRPRSGTSLHFGTRR